MGALQQYIDLVDQHRDIIDAASAPALNRLRDTALAKLRSASLPRKGDEGYVKTSPEDMFAPDFGLNVTRANMPIDLAKSFKCDVPNLSTLLAVVANDMFVPTDTLVSNLPDGVEVMSLRRAAEDYPALIEAHYGKVAAADNVATALNTLLAQDGVAVILSKGVKVSKPIQIVNILSSQVPLMAVRRVLVIAQEGASADIIFCDHTQDAGVDFMASQVVEIVAERDSALSILDMEESSASTRRLNQVYVSQHHGSSVTINSATLLNGVTRNEFNVDILGKGASTNLYGMVIASGDQVVDNCSNVMHVSGGSKSQQRFRYVLDDKAVGAFEGGIEVSEGAKGTEAYQSNGNVLASADARMHTEPRLLIYNDDVKCSHGASTGQLDEQALFYMQTRGIPRDEARTMLMQAYLTDVIEQVHPEAVRDRLRHLVERRFAGQLAACHQCLLSQQC